MKLAKLLFTGLLLITFLSNYAQATDDPRKNTLEVYFSDTLDISDLSKIKIDLEQKNIQLNYRSLKFSQQGKLTGIEYDVRTKKYGGGDKADDLKKEIGFIINTDSTAKYGLFVGSKEAIQNRKMVLEKQK